MLKKINKKSIIALFVTIVMIASMSLSASAYSIFAKISECSHKSRGVFGYALTSDLAQAQTAIPNHAGCSNPGAKIVYVIILDKAPPGSSVFVIGTINGTLVNGDWAATLDYTPPAGSKIVASSVSLYACDDSITGSFN